MSKNSNGIVRAEREGSTLIIEVDRQDKMTGFTPEMFEGVTQPWNYLSKTQNFGLVFFALQEDTLRLD